MDDLAQLQSRVEAARERLGDVESDQRKYENQQADYAAEDV